jgi:hypothetical protein
MVAMKRALFASLVALLSASVAPGAEPGGKPRTIWQGVIHLGDNPEAYPEVVSAGITFQIPFTVDPSKKAKVTIRANDVKTEAGDGHYVDVIAHFEEGRGPAKEVVVDTFRIKDYGTKDLFEFEFDPDNSLGGKRPDYYSIRIKIDTAIGYTLWDDFLVKRIDIGPVE